MGYLIKLTARTIAISLAALSSFNTAQALAQTVENESDLPPRPRAFSTDRNSDPTDPERGTAKNLRLEFQKNGGVVYRHVDGLEIKCDVYIPEGAGPFPAILAVHGGAWRQGTKFALLRHAWRMAESGYVVVAINYRHAPKYPFPAQVHDCKYAVRWMKANATKYKIDPDQVGAFGYSAGGHLVSLLGTSDANDGLEEVEIEERLARFDSRVKAVAAGGAPCEFHWLDEDSRILNYWLGGTRNERPKTYRAASATSYVTPDDPPFFFFHGELDALVPPQSTRILHELLIKSGVKSQHFVAPNSGHLGTFSDLDWMDKAIEFFDRHLKDD